MRFLLTINGRTARGWLPEQPEAVTVGAVMDVSAVWCGLGDLGCWLHLSATAHHQRLHGSVVMTAQGGARTAVTFAPLSYAWVPPREIGPNASRYVPKGWLGKLHAEARQVGYVTGLRWWNGGKYEQTETGPRRRLTITVTKPRLSDLDNLTAALKWTIDGVVKGGAARDDSPRWLEVVVKQVKGKPACTLLEFEEIDDHAD